MSKIISVTVDIKEAGKPDLRTRFVMDPDYPLNVSQERQFDNVLDNEGNVVDFKPIGKPTLVISGVIEKTYS